MCKLCFTWYCSKRERERERERGLERKQNGKQQCWRITRQTGKFDPLCTSVAKGSD